MGVFDINDNLMAGYLMAIKHSNAVNRYGTLTGAEFMGGQGGRGDAPFTS